MMMMMMMMGMGMDSKVVLGIYFIKKWGSRLGGVKGALRI